jgi:hypothetical protein
MLSISRVGAADSIGCKAQGNNANATVTFGAPPVEDGGETVTLTHRFVDLPIERVHSAAR